VETVGIAPIHDLAGWQRVLDRHQELFAEMGCGPSIGLVPRYHPGADGAKRAVVMPVSEPVPMLVWERAEGRMAARDRVFHGLNGVSADLLFVAEEGALEAVLARAGENPFGELKRQIRAARIQVFVMRTRRELAALGYEDFLECLGLPFLGPCR
jgi:hypothetical protein